MAAHTGLNQIPETARQKPISYVDVAFLSLTYVSRMIEDLYFQDFTIGGGGIVFYTFIVFFAYTIIKNSDLLAIVLNNKGLHLISLFTASAFVIESMHPNPYYRDASRSFYMLISVPLFAVWVYKDIRFLYYIILIFLMHNMLYTLNVVLTISPGEVFSAGDSNMSREIVINNLFFTSNLNGVGYMSGTSIILCIILLKFWSYSSNTRIFIYICLGLFTYSLVLSISRSAYINLILITVVYMIRSGYKIKPIHLIALFAVLTAYIGSNIEAINDFLFSRFDEISFNEDDTSDSRSLLYIKLFRQLDEVILYGVGEGEYYGSWGLNSPLAKASFNYETDSFSYTVIPAHNSFLQIVYYWGFFPLAIFLVYNYRMFTYLKKGKAGAYDMLAIVLFFSTFVTIIFSNSFYNKDFSMIYGIIVGLHLYRKYKGDPDKYLKHAQAA